MSTKPTRSWPLRQMVTSEARGCECGGTEPFGTMSIRDMVMPKVLSPGKSTVLIILTVNPNWLVLVLAGLDRTDVVKWGGFALFGSMHGTPLMKSGLWLSAMQ